MPGITCMIGDLYIEAAHFANVLEDLPRETKVDGETAIPAGVYKIVLTRSDRAAKGTLWSPSDKHLLPLLLDVPGFDGIRIHAGNTDRNTRGCLLVGHWNGGEFISNSRAALTLLMEKLDEDPENSIEIVNQEGT